MATAFLSFLPTHVPRSCPHTHPCYPRPKREREIERAFFVRLFLSFPSRSRARRRSRKKRRSRRSAGEKNSPILPTPKRHGTVRCGAERVRERCTENIYGRAVDKITGEFTRPVVVVLAFAKLSFPLKQRRVLLLRSSSGQWRRGTGRDSRKLVVSRIMDSAGRSRVREREKERERGTSKRVL